MKIDLAKIGIKVEPIYRRRGRYSQHDNNEIWKLRIWLFKRDEPYPFNYIGNGTKTICANLGISLKEAKKLLILKLRGLLPSVQDRDLKEKIEKRIRELEVGTFPIKCNRCGEEFERTQNMQKNCETCREWLRKHGKFAYTPLSTEEKEFLKQIRRAESG